jgi:hypothetical protein
MVETANINSAANTPPTISLTLEIFVFFFGCGGTLCICDIGCMFGVSIKLAVIMRGSSVFVNR